MKYKFLYFFVLVLIFLICFTNHCSDEDCDPDFNLPDYYGPNDFDQSTLTIFRKSANSDQEGLLCSLRGLPEMRGTLRNLSFWLKPGKPFKGELLIGNYYQQTSEFKIICLLNYEQISFYLNGKYAHSHLVTIKSREEIIWSIETEKLKKGRHDLIILAFRNLQVHDRNLKFRIRSRYMFTSCRINLYVGSRCTPTPLWTMLTPIRCTAPIQNVFITKDNHSDWNDIWSEHQFQTKVPISYTIHLINGSDSLMNSAVVAFLNGEQKPINHNLPFKTIFTKVPARSSVKILASVQCDTIQDKNELFLIQFNNPFCELEPEPLRMTRCGYKLNSTQRVLLIKHN